MNKKSLERRRMPRRDALLQTIATAQAEGYTPSIRDLVAATDITSTSVVTWHLDKMERFGWIERGKKMARTIRITSAGRSRLEILDKTGR